MGGEGGIDDLHYTPDATCFSTAAVDNRRRDWVKGVRKSENQSKSDKSERGLEMREGQEN